LPPAVKDESACIVDFFNKQLSKGHVGMNQTVIFMIIRLVTLSVKFFLMSLSLRPDEQEFISNLKKISSDFSLKFVLKINSRKKGTGSEVNITSDPICLS
jgi:hypothetical protein